MSETLLTSKDQSELRRAAVSIAVGLQPTILNQASSLNQQPVNKSVDKVLDDAEKIYQFLIK